MLHDHCPHFVKMLHHHCPRAHYDKTSMLHDNALSYIVWTMIDDHVAKAHNHSVGQ